MKTCVAIPGAGLGDCIMALPAIRHLAKLYDVTVVSDWPDLFEMTPYKNIPLGMKRWTYPHALRWLVTDRRRILKEIGDPYLAVRFVPGLFRHILTYNASYQLYDGLGYGYLGRRFLDLVGGSEMEYGLRIETNEEREFVVYPYSSSPYRAWPRAAWQHVIHHLPGKVTVVGQTSVPMRYGDGVEDLTNMQSLRRLAETVKSAKVFVCTNSGPMHLAIATGVPTVALFGVISPEFNVPEGANVTRMYRRDERSSVPYHVPHMYPYRGRIEEIKPQEVIRACDAMLKNQVGTDDWYEK